MPSDGVGTADPALRDTQRASVGQSVSTASDGGTLELTVDRLTVDPRCTSSPSPRPHYGHFLRLDVTASYSNQCTESLGTSLQGVNWTYAAPDGTENHDLATEAANTCLAGQDQITNPIPADGQPQSGGVLLDVPTVHGTLVFEKLRLDY